MIDERGFRSRQDGCVKRGDDDHHVGIKLQSKTSVGNNTNMIRVYKIRLQDTAYPGPSC